MKLFILSPESCSWKVFLEFWEKMYEENDLKRDDELYTPNIGISTKSGVARLESLNTHNVTPLWEWKHGRKLPRKLARWPRRIRSKLEGINRIRRLSAGEARKKVTRLFEPKNDAPVWTVFSWHICRPDIYPIYDRYTHRACSVLLGLSLVEKPSLQDYFDHYMDFYFECQRRAKADWWSRSLDRALVDFGYYMEDFNISL